MSGSNTISICLASLAASAAVAGSLAPARAALPPAAQAAFNKGLVAAGQQQWDLALQSFQDARKAAPDAPEVFYNLGLTESRMPGRELRAVAWFGAYLTAEPRAANASDVRTFIAALEAKNEDNTRRLIKTLERAAKGHPDSAHIAPLSGLESVLASVWGALGDIPDTERMVAAARADDPHGNDPPGGSFGDARESSQYNLPLALARANVGDFTGAKQYVGRIPTLAARIDAEVAIADVQRKSGDLAGARETLQIAAADAAADAAAAGANRSDKQWAAYRQKSVAIAQELSGDPAAAQATIQAAVQNLQTFGHLGEYAEEEFAEAQAGAGDIPGARMTQTLVGFDRFSLEYKIKRVQARANIFGSTYEWTTKLDDDGQHDDYNCEDLCGLKTPLFLDYTQEMKSSDRNVNWIYLWRGLVGAANHEIDTRKDLDRMLQRLAAQREGLRQLSKGGSP